MDCLPDSLKGRSYYHPTQEGREKQLAQRMEEIRSLNRKVRFFPRSQREYDRRPPFRIRVDL
jgi:DNA-binding PadR family transcriptional regulator